MRERNRETPEERTARRPVVRSGYVHAVAGVGFSGEPCPDCGSMSTVRQARGLQCVGCGGWSR